MPYNVPNGSRHFQRQRLDSSVVKLIDAETLHTVGN